jgi:hypothetical protein
MSLNFVGFVVLSNDFFILETEIYRNYIELKL